MSCSLNNHDPMHVVKKQWDWYRKVRCCKQCECTISEPEVDPDAIAKIAKVNTVDGSLWTRGIALTEYLALQNAVIDEYQKSIERISE
jgi:hypothetical protein